MYEAPAQVQDRPVDGEAAAEAPRDVAVDDRIVDVERRLLGREQEIPLREDAGADVSGVVPHDRPRDADRRGPLRRRAAVHGLPVDAAAVPAVSVLDVRVVVLDHRVLDDVRRPVVVEPAAVVARIPDDVAALEHGVHVVLDVHASALGRGITGSADERVVADRHVAQQREGFRFGEVAGHDDATAGATSLVAIDRAPDEGGRRVVHVHAAARPVDGVAQAGAVANEAAALEHGRPLDVHHEAAAVAARGVVLEHAVLE